MRNVFYRSSINGDWVYGNLHDVQLFTDFTDKNGMKIFEGDVLIFTNDEGETSFLDVIYANGFYTVPHGNTNVIPDILDEFIAKRSVILCQEEKGLKS